MAKLLIDWLNEEVGLSVRILSIDDDFRNGYLLGEILSRFNQQPNFDKFTPKLTPDSKINNFCLLEPTMRQIGVHFDSKTAFDVMNATRGVTKTLLYELKTALDRIIKNSQPAIGKASSTQRQKSKIIRVIQPAKSAYDKTMSITFENTIRTMMENPKDILMDRAIERFTEKTREFKNSVSFEHSEMLGELQSERQRVKEINQYRKKHEGVLTEALDLINMEQWKQNQIVAKQRRIMGERLVTKEEGKTLQRKSNNLENSRQAAIDGFAEFEKRIEREVFHEDPDLDPNAGMTLRKTVAGITNSGAPEVVYLDEAYLKSGLVKAQKTIRQTHQDMYTRQQEHDRRRRKFARVREGSQTEALQERASSEVMNQLKCLSYTEQIEDKFKSRVLLYGKIIVENHANRRAIINNIDQDCAARQTMWQKYQVCTENQAVIAPRLESQICRINALKSSQFAANRHDGLEFVGNIVSRIVDLTEWVISCRQLGLFGSPSSPTTSASRVGSAQGTPAATRPTSALGAGDDLSDMLSSAPPCLPEALWHDASTMFISDLVIADALPCPHEINVHKELPNSLSDRPLCLDRNWVLGDVFQTQTVVDSSQCTLVIAKHLSSCDDLDYVNAISTANVAGGVFDAVPEFPTEAVAPAAAAPVASSAEQSGGNRADSSSPGPEGGERLVGLPMNPADYQQFAPLWLFDVPSRYILGQTIATVREVVDPIPVIMCGHNIMPKFQYRAALCGTSALARDTMAKAMKARMPKVAFLCTGDLVHESCEYARQLVISGEWKRSSMMSTGKDSLALTTLSCCESGMCISDETYVALIEHAILEAGNPAEGEEKKEGFVLVDFPNTKRQAQLLIEAMSGIDYEQHKEQLLDYASSLMSMQACQFEMHDPLKCGLDEVIFFDEMNGSTAIIDERLRARRNLFTGAITHVTADMPKMDGLEEVITPLLPIETAGLDTMVIDAGMNDLQIFLKKLNILSMVKYSSEQAELLNTTDQLASTIAEQYFPPEVEDNAALMFHDNLEEEEVEEEEEEEPVPVDPSTVIIPMPKINPGPATVHSSLAGVLKSMWAVIETRSHNSGNSYFQALRDIRYQTAQRRRQIHDLISHMLVRRDERQSLFEDFRNNFNNIEMDFRYDADCVAELHLRTFELGNSIWYICDVRKKEAEDLLQTIAYDGVLQLQIHRCRCEAVAMLQSELNKFHTSLHLLFDFTKAVASYDRRTRYCNPLEVACVLTEEAQAQGGSSKAVAGKGGKDAKPPPSKDGKKGAAKDAPVEPVVFREPLAPVIIQAEVLKVLPDPPSLPTAEPVIDPKAKGGKPPAKGKKGAEEVVVAVNPWVQAEKAAQDLAAQWSQGTFTAQRIVYNNEESLCRSLEFTIWHEAERLKYSITKIKEYAETEAVWLEAMETTILEEMKKLISSRYSQEAAVGARLVDMIGDCIDNAEPIRESWLLAPDAIAVLPDKLMVPPIELYPVPTSLIEFTPDKLNEEQWSVMNAWLSRVRMGDVVLEQDIHELLDRSLSSIGPLATTYCFPAAATATATASNNSGLKHITLPRNWRDVIGAGPTSTSTVANGVQVPVINKIRNCLSVTTVVHGTLNEHTGTMHMHKIEDVLKMSMSTTG